VSEAEVNAAARERVGMMLARMPDAGPPVAEVQLSDYADAETFALLLPSAGWTFFEWRAVNTEVARQLRAAGHRVRLVRLTAGEYFDFLIRYRLKNTPQNRAPFVAWPTAPEPKPEPLRDSK
jgi:hypothetical protein